MGSKNLRVPGMAERKLGAVLHKRTRTPNIACHSTLSREHTLRTQWLKIKVCPRHSHPARAFSSCLWCPCFSCLLFAYHNCSHPHLPHCLSPLLPHQRVWETDEQPLRRTPPWGRRLADLPDHLPAQVMSSTSPTSPITRTRSTIRSTSPKTAQDFWCSDDVTGFSDSARGMPTFEALPCGRK